MADQAHEPFDLDRLRQLVKLMEKHDLREVKLKGGGQEWILRRGAEPVPVVASPVGIPVPPAVVPVAAPPLTGESGEKSPDDGLVEINSPMVGTFYRAPSPEEPPFVKEGDRVTHDSVVCMIEAMKFFNQIKSEVSGAIVKVCVSDGDPVEFGQPLFKVKPE